MHITRSIPFVLLVACGGAPAASTTPVVNEPVPGTTRDVTPCPADAALDDVARRAFGGHTGELMAICTEVYAGEPLWLIDGYVDAPYDDTGEHGGVTLAAVLMTPAGEVTWSQIDDGHPPAVLDKTMPGGWTAVDLDGDGEDELLRYEAWMSHGYETVTLNAYDVVERALVASTSLPLVEDNSAAAFEEHEIQVCRADYKVVDGPDRTKQIQIVTDAASNATGESCPAPGTHVYRWDGKALVDAG